MNDIVREKVLIKMGAYNVVELIFDETDRQFPGIYSILYKKHALILLQGMSALVKERVSKYGVSKFGIAQFRIQSR